MVLTVGVLVERFHAYSSEHTGSTVHNIVRDHAKGHKSVVSAYERQLKHENC